MHLTLRHRFRHCASVSLHLFLSTPKDKLCSAEEPRINSLVHIRIAIAIAIARGTASRPYGYARLIAVCARHGVAMHVIALPCPCLRHGPCFEPFRSLYRASLPFPVGPNPSTAHCDVSNHSSVYSCIGHNTSVATLQAKRPTGNCPPSFPIRITAHISRPTAVMPDYQTQIDVPWNLPHDWYKPTAQTIFPKRAPTQVGSTSAQGPNKYQPGVCADKVAPRTPSTASSPPQPIPSASDQEVLAPIRSLEWIREQIKDIEDDESRRLTEIACLG